MSHRGGLWIRPEGRGDVRLLVRPVGGEGSQEAVAVAVEPEMAG